MAKETRFSNDVIDDMKFHTDTSDTHFEFKRVDAKECRRGGQRRGKHFVPKLVQKMMAVQEQFYQLNFFLVYK